MASPLVKRAGVVYNNKRIYEKGMAFMLDRLFSGKTVTLLGAGVSNMPLAEIAVKKGATLTVRDKKSLEELGENGQRLLALGAKLCTGEGYMENITEDVIFRSPGIRPDLPPIREAVERGSKLVSEMEVFLSLHPCPVYAITGSDGKTTTTTLTSLLLQSGMEGEVFLGGNIGDPLLNRYDRIRAEDAVAVELSSFQLMTVDAPVDVAAITNIEPNHLNWHVDMEEYVWAKKRILTHCGRAVLNYDNAATRCIGEAMQKTTDTPVTFFSLSPLPEGILRKQDSAAWLDGDDIYTYFPGDGQRLMLKRSDIRLPGIHNTANYITAIAVTYGKTTPEAIRQVARTFGGVEHRLEFVREKDGVTYINGAIDSSPTRTAAALSAVADRPVVLIAGGYDKNIPYEPLAEAIFASSVHTLVLTGKTAGKIRAAVEAHPAYGTRGLTLLENPSFDGAVADAAGVAKAGDTVLLSPASASFDQFANFAEKGKHFKKLVAEL